MTCLWNKESRQIEPTEKPWKRSDVGLSKVPLGETRSFSLPPYISLRWLARNMTAMNGALASSSKGPLQTWVLRDSKTLMKPALSRSRLTLHPVNQRAFHPIDISQLKQKTMRLIQALHHSNKEERIVYPLETTWMVRYDQVGSLEPCMSLKSAWRSLYWVMDLLRNLSSTLPTCSRKWDCKWNKESAQGNCRSLTKMICSTIISSIHTRVTCSDSIHEVADLTARKAAALGQVLNSVQAHRG